MLGRQFFLLRQSLETCRFEESFYAYSQKIDTPELRLHCTFDSPEKLALLSVLKEVKRSLP